MAGIGLILQSNYLRELSINECKLGAPNNFLLVQKLANSISYNSSLRSIDISKNQLTDDVGCILLQSILN